MNLLTDPWLSYRLTDGSERDLPLAEALADPHVVDFALPRADFHGAAYQLAIGVLQTAMAPGNVHQWNMLYQQPPALDTLQQAISRISHAFELEGEGPRFMQDFDALADAKPAPISGLLIEAPGENTVKQNTDLFIKRGLGDALSPGMAALALFTLQINAPSGGQGHRTGLRGGGPLTTLVLPHENDVSLWQKLWLNVLDRDAFRYDDPDLHSPLIFPWLGPTKISKAKGTEIYHNEAHPLTMYWAMPRRIRLIFEDEAGICGLGLKPTGRICRQLRTVNYGNNYAGTWGHPLTHYRFNPKKPDEDHLSSKGQPGGIQYKQWHSLAYTDREGGSLPAKVVSRYLEDLAPFFSFDWGEVPRLWVFGYDMDNMKARGWYSNEFPLIRLDPDQRDRQLLVLRDMQSLATEVLWQCRTAVKSAWFEKPSEAKGDTSQIDLQFWQRTQAAFFTLVRELLSSAEDLPPEAANRWLGALKRTAQDIFDELGLESLAPDRNMARKIKARRNLTGWLAGSKRIKAYRAEYRLDSLIKEENR
ncbi:CRISPR-associated protein, Cse1 family [Marinobacterium lacunae]|uniref:CRISPR-associated protein, Cse1 family n=1 Tax=Marinobacterium lacunae TaxID=1232683 RepID=A0A081G1M7_9GAMM|nr:type I-E CRISPR-associated protein Cse1/CasA [Marinobacterium lacunae]KEA64682.1 CRISPR-associated protein, Cse1 family [Marinobacterium lacunae]